MSEPEIPIVLLGFGNVGQSLVRLLDLNDSYRREGVVLRIDSVFDRGGGIAVERGALRGLLETKRREKTVSAHRGGLPLGIEEALDRAGSKAVLVDTSITDADSGGPGLSPARWALGRGNSVAFASKGPLVAAYAELVSIARDQGARIGASAAVGIPLPSMEVGVIGLRGAVVRRVRGILNDTANQILRDLEAGLSLDSAIEKARRDGTIEEDPRLDLDGWDAAFKLLILARTLWDPAIELDRSRIRGVGALAKKDLDTARAQEKRVRLVATGEVTEGGSASLGTESESLSAADPFYSLGPGEKAVVFETDTMGTITLRSSKGGPLATAACVLKDVLNLAAPRRPFA